MVNGIRLAKEEDIPSLCRIWKECFPDSEEYIRCFYKENFNHIKVLAYFIDGAPVSMMHLIDSCLKDSDISQRALFIYATGTLPEHRGKGYMGELIKTLTKKADKEALALFLKPSSPTTQSYYQSFGFSPDGGFSLLDIETSGNSPFDSFDISAEEYNKMREAAFSDIPHARWDNEHINRCLEDNAYFSGKTLRIQYDNNDYFLLAYPQNDTLIINETNLSVSQLEAVCGSLCALFKTKRIKLFLAQSSPLQDKNTVSNLLYNSVVSNPYINLILI